MSEQYAICVKHSDSQMWRPALACPPQYDTAPLAEVARAYEQWEADLIASPEAWGGAFPGGERDLPKFTEALWDRLLEIQAMRNAALSKLSQQQGSDATGSPQDTQP